MPPKSGDFSVDLLAVDDQLSWTRNLVVNGSRSLRCREVRFDSGDALASELQIFGLEFDADVVAADANCRRSTIPRKWVAEKAGGAAAIAIMIARC